MLTHSTRNGLPDHTDPEGKFFLYLQVGSYETACIPLYLSCVTIPFGLVLLTLGRAEWDIPKAEGWYTMEILNNNRILLFVCLDNEIVCFLKVQIAEAINLQDKNLMAQLQETMRCVCRFDNRTCRKLLASIAEDYR